MKRKLKKSNVYFYLCRLYQLPRVLIFRFLSSTKIAGSPRRLQPVQAIGAGLISIGSDVMLGYFPSPQFFSSYCYLEARFPSARISIGNNTRINNDSVFRLIKKETEVLAKQDDKEYPLEIGAFRQEQKVTRDAVKRIEKLIKLDQAMNISFLKQDEQRYVSEDKDKSERYKNWLNNVGKDRYVEQAVKVINDMVNQQNLAKASQTPAKTF